MSTPEGRVKTKVSKWLKELRRCWPFMPVQSGYGAVALDYIVCIRGAFVSIETKAPGGELTPTQQATKAAIIAAGGVVLVIWDDDSLSNAREIINGLRGSIFGHAAFYPEARRLYDQHLRAVEQGKTPAAPARRDHGASGAQSQRHAVSRSR
jgi:hypothetical protein